MIRFEFKRKNPPATPILYSAGIKNHRFCVHGFYVGTFFFFLFFWAMGERWNLRLLFWDLPFCLKNKIFVGREKKPGLVFLIWQAASKKSQISVGKKPPLVYPTKVLGAERYFLAGNPFSPTLFGGAFCNFTGFGIHLGAILVLSRWEEDYKTLKISFLDAFWVNQVSYFLPDIL